MIVTNQNINDFTFTDELPLSVISRDYIQEADDFKYLNTKAYGNNALDEVKRITTLNLSAISKLPDDNKVKKYLTELLVSANKTNNDHAAWMCLCKFNAMWLDRLEYLYYMKHK